MNDTPRYMKTNIDYLRFQKEMLAGEPVYIKGYGNDFGPYHNRSNSCYGLFGTTIMDDYAFDTTRYRDFYDNLREGLGKHTTGGKKMLLREKKIIFSGPCTIILWEDGTKTMARVSEGETFDPEKGVAICFMKKILGHTEANKILRKAHKQYDKEMGEVKNA